MTLRSHEALHDLELMVRARHGLVHLDAREEDRATLLLRHLADRLGVPLFLWSRSQGIRRADLDAPVYDTKTIDKALAHVAQAQVDALYHFTGVDGASLGAELTAALARDVARAMEARVGAVILTGPASDPPAVLGPAVSRFRMPAPDVEEFRDLLKQIVRDVSARTRVVVDLTPAETDQLLSHLAGLTLMEAEKILTAALVDDGRLTIEDVRHIGEAKRKIVEENGLLEFWPVEATMADVADLVGFKAWLAKRTAVVSDPAGARTLGLPFPRGVLLLGVPGCGKSLSAKAVAAEWRLPLLRLDPSSLYDKYIGESEKNFQKAMETADRMAPVILWIDELEKAFASGGDADGGVSQRILGTFLGWLQERESPVFVVATANDVQRLPPEFLRKGRFDEVFFVDLPDAPTRAEIFRIHLRGRRLDPDTFPVDDLAAATPEFSGSEIEQVVVSALYTAFAEGRALLADDLTAEAARTRPLAVTMSEKIGALRAWARDRTTPAN